jgi:hypothetical protein
MVKTGPAQCHHVLTVQVNWALVCTCVIAGPAHIGSPTYLCGVAHLTLLSEFSFLILPPTSLEH